MSEAVFASVLGPHIERFVAEKRALGYHYEKQEFLLRVFDRHLVDIGHQTVDLPKTVVEGWQQGQPNQSASTRKHYAGAVRRLAKFLIRNGIDAYVQNGPQTAVVQDNFVPYVFTHRQMSQLLAAIDSLVPDTRSPKRHVVFAALFRVLYGCGLRCGEALRLTVGDVDLGNGALTIKEGKFGQDRLVPVADSLLERLRGFSTEMGARSPEEIFFPAPNGRAYTLITPYRVFRHALRTIGIPHRGRGHGPRLHDIRHAFALHRLEDWHRRGVDLDASLPVLATYMGHKSLAGTQRYLRLTAQISSDLSLRLDQAYGHLIPGSSGQ